MSLSFNDENNQFDIGLYYNQMKAATNARNLTTSGIVKKKSVTSDSFDKNSKNKDAASEAKNSSYMYDVGKGGFKWYHTVLNNIVNAVTPSSCPSLFGKSDSSDS